VNKFSFTKAFVVPFEGSSPEKKKGAVVGRVRNTTTTTTTKEEPKCEASRSSSIDFLA
jgi:hypothetical protein